MGTDWQLQEAFEERSIDLRTRFACPCGHITLSKHRYTRQVSMTKLNEAVSAAAGYPPILRSIAPQRYRYSTGTAYTCSTLGLAILISQAFNQVTGSLILFVIYTTHCQHRSAGILSRTSYRTNGFTKATTQSHAVAGLGDLLQFSFAAD